jgi:hypothetical protein
MSLKNGKPNPLNYFNLRKVEFACPHFKYTIIDKCSTSFVQDLDSWIRNTLNNRYYIGQNIALDNTNTVVYNTLVGFESEKELSFFNLACPLLQQR